MAGRGALVRAGLDPDRAIADLAGAGLLDPAATDPTAAIGDLLAAISPAADPTWALAALTELGRASPDLLAQVREDTAWLTRVAAVAGASRPLGDLLARHEDAVHALATLWPVETAEIAGKVAGAIMRAGSERGDRAAAIAVIRRRATADIAARDLTGAIDVESVAGELSALACGVLEGTLTALHAEMAPRPSARLVVIGMGKLGGYELNYVSDVDVMFVHEPVAGADEDDAASEATAVFTELLALLNASTTMGRAYEVDPTLRPEGRSGALSRTIGAFEAYWERWAKTWEFQALIKARPVAGDQALGRALIDRAAAFVYPAELDPGVVDEVRRMKGRVEAKPEVRRHGARQVKLGPGGIRDIEFAVQLLQLVHGRTDPRLRLTGTLPTLLQLAAGGYIADEDAETFAGAYRMLRDIEHRLQLANERRTHTIPSDEASQERLARSLGYVADADAPARAAFGRDLRRVQGTVRDLHAKLFYRPLLESYATVSLRDTELAQPRLDDEAARARLAALGFHDAVGALRDVRTLTSGLTRAATTLRVVLPTFLLQVQETPDPDAGLRRFRDLVEEHGSHAGFVGRLRDHPPSVAGLARVLGTSEVVADLLRDEPRGLEWFDDGVLDVPLVAAEVTASALARLHWQDPMPAVRRLKRGLLLRVILRDLVQEASVGAVATDLTVIAEACLTVGLRAALTELAIEQGGARPEDLPVRMAVIGMGKLGGGELHYVSDLDVMFVHEPIAGGSRQLAHELANAAAEILLKTLGAVTAEGTAFEIDADLRPEGRRGPLSRSLESFEAYYARWSEPWEHQALLRARPVAGDEELGWRLVARAHRLAYPAEFSESDAVAMRRMKARLEKERIKRRQDPKRHLKLGPGGLSDVEWTVQLLQQRHGAAAQILRTPNTMGALDALQDAALLDHRDAAWLRDGYHFLSRVRNHLYLMRQRDVDVLPTAPDTLNQLACGLGYGRHGRQELLDEHLRHVRHVRRVAERVFYGLPEEEDPGAWERR